ncbi:hypothetical protein PV783_13655 [Chitinophaga sp. CC14]|uniref:hypothetical protein n=1 Tax=Chitinophaga sp. CC14 TaxID=3029199 RepID=UPI003B822D7A
MKLMDSTFCVLDAAEKSDWKFFIHGFIEDTARAAKQKLRVLFKRGYISANKYVELSIDFNAERLFLKGLPLETIADYIEIFILSWIYFDAVLDYNPFLPAFAALANIDIRVFEN